MAHILNMIFSMESILWMICRRSCGIQGRSENLIQSYGPFFMSHGWHGPMSGVPLFVGTVMPHFTFLGMSANQVNGAFLPDSDGLGAREALAIGLSGTAWAWATYYGGRWTGLGCIAVFFLPTSIGALRLCTRWCTTIIWHVTMLIWLGCIIFVPISFVLELTLLGRTFEPMLAKPLSENCSVIAEKWRKCAEHPDEWDVRNNLGVASIVKMYGHCAFVAHQVWSRNCTILPIE
jgi:hypothetical protein